MRTTLTLEKDVAARLRILMLHGKKLPNGTDPKSFDHVYALSNFILDLATKNWGREIFRFFVSHRGIAGDLYGSRDPGMRQRDLFAMVYAGHPSKGLDTAIEILRIVREHDPRFSLHIYGGYRLWGEDEQSIPNEPGVFYHGMLGQKDLAQRMQECGYSLILQDAEAARGMGAKLPYGSAKAELPTGRGFLIKAVRSWLTQVGLPHDELQEKAETIGKDYAVVRNEAELTALPDTRDQHDLSFHASGSLRPGRG